jgi:hypothetical protein
MQALGCNQISLTCSLFTSDLIFDRFQGSARTPDATGGGKIYCR